MTPTAESGRPVARLPGSRAARRTSAKAPRREHASPAMRQFLEIKARHPDAILFFQMGDFYEMFYEDALLASKELELALTSRQSDRDGPIPMCGVPVHSVEAYSARLLESGHKVAVCQQVEDSAAAKGIVRREVVRVLTPGTAAHPQLLESKESCYLVGIAEGREGGWGLAWADVSTGEFRACEIAGDAAEALLFDEIERLRPREILLAPGVALPSALRSRLEESRVRLEARGAENFPPAGAVERLAEQFPEAADLPARAKKNTVAAGAAVVLLVYLRENQPGGLPHLRPLSFYRVSDTMLLDAATLRNLELVRSSADGGRKGTLLGLLDETCTAMGGRLLKKWVLAPLLFPEAIRRRADAVEDLRENGERREALRAALGRVQDLERILGRVGLQTANARDLLALGASFSALPAARRALEGLLSAELAELAGSWDSLEDLAEELSGALAADPPASLREGGMFREGVDPELDRLRRASREGKDWLSAYEAGERERTGLPLKVGFNKVFGYYLELSKRFSEQAPPEYTRKQTLVSAERYITAELKRFEEEILGAEEKAKELEYLLFGRLRSKVAAASKRILEAADRVALLDVLASLAEVADRRGYVRPALDEEGVIEILEGRHPVMEADPSAPSFVPNSLWMGEDRQILIVTGPNMSGKSTFLRQSALLILMAQMGSFIPAQSARIGLVDRVFTRVGAHDRLLEGQSTFMVEMRETATILREATPRSFVVLDEVGRGTSTFDGVSIAWAVVEYLHDSEVHRPRTLFATHYHELSELAGFLPRVHNLTVEVRECGEEVVFLRKVSEGSCDRSYGIHVGQLAGLPAEVLARAKELLAELEGAGRIPTAGEPFPARPRLRPGGGVSQLPLFDRPPSPLERAVEALDADSVTPRQALEKLYELKELWRKNKETGERSGR